MLSQIPLRFEFHAAQGFDHYHTGPNAETIERLRDCASHHGEVLIFLWGANGLGKKTHTRGGCRFDDAVNDIEQTEVSRPGAGDRAAMQQPA